MEDVAPAAQDVSMISTVEVRATLKGMKNGNAVGPDDKSAEMLKCLGKRYGEKYWTRLFSYILASQKMPVELRKSVLVQYLKTKGDIQRCNRYGGIKLEGSLVKKSDDYFCAVVGHHAKKEL